MQKRHDVVLDTQGRPISGAAVRVNTYPAGVLATIYSDDGVTTKSNPMVTDSAGKYEYYAANGHYTEIITTTVATSTLNDVLLDDSLTTNQQFVAATGTGNAMVVAAFATGYTLVDGDEIRVRAPGANTSTAPTIDLPGVGILTIYKLGGKALAIGDIGRSGHEIVLRYRASPARAELVEADASIPSVNTIADLKALPSGNNAILVLGYYAAGDGGGGFYWWNSADATADNGGTVIALDVGGSGRFNKLF